MGVRIVTDTSCDLPAELEAELVSSGVERIPFSFHFGQETCLDKSMPMGEFLARAAQTWPTTAAPAVGAYIEAFRRVVQAGHQVLCLTITGRHSATYSAAVLAAKEFGPDQVTVVDTRLVSLAQGLMVLAAVRAARAGAAMSEVIASIQEVQSRIRFYFALETLDYVVKGGRASRLAGALAGLLSLKPILTLVEGELTLIAKPRHRRAATERLIALAKSCLPAETIGVIHIACADQAAQLAAALAQASNLAPAQIPIVETGMALATHGGPGALGVVVLTQS